jgi:hypothetical protein
MLRHHESSDPVSGIGMTFAAGLTLVCGRVSRVKFRL